MNQARTSTSGQSSVSRSLKLVAAAMLISGAPASAAEFTFQYYRFKPTKINSSGTQIQLSEFTFSRAGALLNLNNRNTSGVNVVPVTVTSAGQGTTGNEDPWRVADGKPLANGGTETKWFRNNALVDGNELIFNFGTGVTVDAYNFATGGDSTAFARTPVSWTLAGSNDGTSWITIDVRTDAITAISNLTYQAGYNIPADVPPVIKTFTPPPGIILNNTVASFSWNTQYSTSRSITDGITTTPLAAEVGSIGITPPVDALTYYTFVASKSGSASASAVTPVRTVAGGPSSYRYVRYSITQRRITGSEMVQVSEFEFYNRAVSNTRIPVVAISNPGGSNTNPGDGEYVSKLIDGDTGSKWLDANRQPVIFDFGSQVTFDSYSFVTGNDAPERDPIRWKLEGSNDGTTWDLIENLTFDYPTTETRNASSTALPLPGSSLPPLIDFFTGTTGSIVLGESVDLSYSTQAAATVTISPAPGSVALDGTVTVSPTVTTTYQLTAASSNGNVPASTASFTVNVVADPGNAIGYTDFASAGTEIDGNGSTSITAPASTLPGRLRITPEQQGQLGSAWFVKKLDGRAGFETTFGMSLNQEHPNNFVPADGLSFVIHNSPSGTNEMGTGENGVSQNALNICFHTFGFDANSASLAQVRSGTTVLASCVTYNKPGVELHGVPAVDTNGVPLPTGGFPFTLGSLASAPPYQIRVVYMPHNLDVYLDGIAIMQNVDVDLEAIGATDAAGKSWFGFSARTGGNVQNNDITSWQVKFGDYSALPPFGIVKTRFKYTAGNPKPTALDLVWNASYDPMYDVVSSEDLGTWTPASTLFGEDGQLGITLDLPATVGTAPAAFFRVEEHSAD